MKAAVTRCTVPVMVEVNHLKPYRDTIQVLCTDASSQFNKGRQQRET